MIRIRQVEDPDRKRWDAYVLSHPLAGTYHLFAWKQAVERAYYHKCPYLVAEDGRGEIQGVLPLVLMKPPLLKPVLVSLPFCDYGGVLSSNTEAAHELIAHALDIAASNRAAIDIRYMHEEPFLQKSSMFSVS
ncbi:MAG TPA: hypothetical protein PK181_04440, partial [Methanothrix soehngenii]|nr:hypothetical protein [Methanothrix soehngenii]